MACGVGGGRVDDRPGLVLLLLVVRLEGGAGPGLRWWRGVACINLLCAARGEGGQSRAGMIAVS